MKKSTKIGTLGTQIFCIGPAKKGASRSPKIAQFCSRAKQVVGICEIQETGKRSYYTCARSNLAA